MGKFVPITLFLLCIAIAGMIALVYPESWPASVAIAIAGAALGLASGARGEVTAETGPLSEDLSELRRTDAGLRAGIDDAHQAIDELSNVAERLATMIERQQAALRDMREGSTAQSVASGVDLRLAELETRVAAIAQAPRAAPIAPKRPVATETEDALHPFMPPRTPRTAASASVSLSPIFEPELGPPVAFLIASDDASADAPVLETFRQAQSVAAQLESAGRDLRLFVRIAAEPLRNNAVRTDLLALLDGDAALRRRLTLMTPQDGFDGVAQKSLAEFAERGCRFALENVTNWSLNLMALARAGLGYIAVDGPALVRSAETQGGDPKRLAEALSRHGILLLAAGITDREQIEDVRTLGPALVMGEGLGAARVLNAAGRDHP